MRQIKSTRGKRRLNNRDTAEASRLKELTGFPKLDEIDDDAYLTRRHFSILISLAEQTIANRESKGQPIVAPRKVGGGIRYRAGEVKKFLRGEQQPAA